MLEVNVKEARAEFSQLLNKVERGQDVILIRRGKKVAHLVPLVKEKKLPGLAKFRQSIVLLGDGLSSIVQNGRDEERY